MKYVTALLFMAALLLPSPTLGQEHHGHPPEHAQLHQEHYVNWVNGKDEGCCNNAHCGPLDAKNERTVGGQLEVFVRGRGIATGTSAWCPVLRHHYLSKGNAPNWGTSHSCVYESAGETPCTQFICYQPKPGT